MTMSISAADASALSQVRLASQVSTAVARKALDQQKQQGQAALDLLTAAAEIATGPVHPGKGQVLDVTA